MAERAATNPIKSYSMQYDSMEPTITANLDVLGDRSHYTKHRPKRWDVIVFTLPSEVSERGPQAGQYLKRIVGLPGETIHFTRDELIINGAKVSIPARLADRFSSFKQFPDYKFGNETYRIPDDSVFVIGDNPRIYVVDSRVFGAIPIRNIESRVVASVRADPIT